MRIFEPTKFGHLDLKNPLFMAPMCMYQVEKHDGKATSFHLAHYTQRAIGQIGCIIVEATGVSPEGRITDLCLGLYDDQQIEPLQAIVDAVHLQGSKIAIQLNHAGRKSEAKDGIDVIYAPSEIAFSDHYRTPKEMDLNDIKRVIHDFKEAARRAQEAGFDAIELHGAHGYLVNQFMSPASNLRNDEYAQPAKFAYDVLTAMKEVFHGDLWIRVSSQDFAENGYKVPYMIEILQTLKPLITGVHVSSGGNTPIAPPHIYPGYQVKDALQIKHALGLPVIVVGLLNEPDLVNYLLEAEQVDYVALGRPLLDDPNWYLHHAKARKKEDLIFSGYKRGI